jgi:hypothetical protein
MRYAFPHGNRHQQSSDQPPTSTNKGSLQPQHPTQAQRAPVQSQVVASYAPLLPRESEMPDEWGYPVSTAPQVSSVPFLIL